MNKQFKDLFAYSKTERNGIFILIIILLGLILFNVFLPYFSNDEDADFEQFKNDIALFETNQKHIKDSLSRQTYNASSKKTNSEIAPFLFDPNNLPDQKWKALGMSEKQIKVIKNYENKGGKFYHVDDLSRIYSISKEEFDLLKPYIVIKRNDEITSKKNEPDIKITPFTFDPNVISPERWLDLGLDEKLVKTIMNYRNKGGHFNRKQDLKKIYGFNEKLFSILESYITISDTINQRIAITPKTFNIEINSADSLDLQLLKGIGPAFANRVINYRQLLGGFYTTVQLLEVYGMDSVRYQGLVQNISVNQKMIRKININTATIKELIRHPYIEYYLAKSILKLRSDVGQFNDIAQIRDLKSIPSGIFQKIEPYITVD